MISGIVFMNEDKLTSDLSNVEYKIRMDIENVPTTARMMSFFWVPGPEASFLENMRYFRGFVQIQDMVDKAIIQLSAASTKLVDYSRRKRETNEELDWAVYTQQEPYHTLSWFAASFLEMALTQACVTAVLRYGHILPRTDPTLIFAMLLVFGAAVLSFW
ncbi:putative ATP-binding cassette [Operophtera brumata]|uniref:Putative ATP-binding cassette n=1 Tax=Operophtera brumata TaxID=104452 RepID=A0A0L7LSF1_OPEBR|nr:putative ATP-binding cassette [Operophtera brumata]